MPPIPENEAENNQSNYQPDEHIMLACPAVDLIVQENHSFQVFLLDQPLHQCFLEPDITVQVRVGLVGIVIVDVGHDRNFVQFCSILLSEHNAARKNLSG